MMALETAYERVGAACRDFRCCDTSFHVEVKGVRAAAAAAAARQTVEELEDQLNAFDADSGVSRLNSRGAVENKHVARLVHRGLEYYERTEGIFDIHQGSVEHSLKAYLRGDDDSVPETFETGTVSISGHHVSTDVTLDLNGLAKGYIVDRATETLAGLGRRGFVSGGGDMSPPTGPVSIKSPYGDAKPLKILETNWAVATSGSYRRERDGTDHIYDPATERLGSRHESVTVLAERDCVEADALATTLAVLPLDEARTLAEDWDGLEALIVHEGVFHMTDGFDTHVLDA
ncbi:FAD:protein FMN transferase [Halorubrum amylolyticum]|uniref:FAD:protein FMN transferase n=1 Tax=Halorubrum amylolyticum TaxID=2508724 RepID=UPI00100918FA|nr:FAD:protein FMN transferase [Halorubrum amylolyticum]